MKPAAAGAGDLLRLSPGKTISVIKAAIRLGLDLDRIHRDPALVAPETLVLHLAIDQREEGVVATQADVLAGVEAGAELAHQDVAGADGLAVTALDTPVLRVGVAAVPGRALSLLMSHSGSPTPGWR